MKRSFLAILLALMLLVSTSCAQEVTYTKYQHYFFGTFDTIITLLAYTETEDEFKTYAKLAEDEMIRYHEIFDQYNSYTGIKNLYEVNQNAGSAPVEAEPELIDLLVQVKEWRTQYNYGSYGCKTTPALGTVLLLWHNARTDGTYIPEMKDLLDAAKHINYEKVVIDTGANTVFFADPEMRLDVGAVAKGYAAQKVADTLREAGLESFILNAGGNVICGDAPRDGREQWTVAVENVDGITTRLKLGLKNMSIVTSGDYQRYYEVDGVRYHHLIDPVTLFPAKYMRSVSIIHPDSGLADFLSTSCFLLPYEESRALIESIPEAEATWLLNDGTEYWTEGFEALMNLVK